MLVYFGKLSFFLKWKLCYIFLCYSSENVVYGYLIHRSINIRAFKYDSRVWSIIFMAPSLNYFWFWECWELKLLGLLVWMVIGLGNKQNMLYGGFSYWNVNFTILRNIFEKFWFPYSWLYTFQSYHFSLRA